MGRYKCRYCHHDVSPKAAQCPGCGEPNPAADTRSILVLIFKKIGLLLIVLMLPFWTCNIDLFDITPFFYYVMTASGLILFLKGWAAA